MNALIPETTEPLYKQLYESLLNEIKIGKYEVGDKIPSEEQLRNLYGVSRVTVRSAIKQLVDENILVKRHGKGTFVAMPVYVESMTAGGSFTESGLQMQKKPSTKIISMERRKVKKDILRALGVEEEEKVFSIERLRLLEDKPAIFEIDYFRNEFDFELKDDSLLETLRKYKGLIAAYFDNIIEIALADSKIAEELGVLEGEPLVKINQTVLDSNNQILYFNEQYVRSEYYKVAIRSYNK
ncbi:MAG: GntR family transcriptional regulator [Lactobacillales bacterium]|jgi:GntR family transcriptional regulator|nr:GntR family transcriptional regulator [Lactobacillales bacterium]